MAIFTVWAPYQNRMRIHLGSDGEPLDMNPMASGWWQLDVPEAEPGSDYAFLIGDDETPLPDPRSLWQPYGVHRASRVYDHEEYSWADSGWTGRQLAGSVLYELHIGTFTPTGTLDAAIEHLDYLAELGVDFVELLPMNAVNGVQNWGYDGACWYAVHEPYGGPDALKRFVDACHARGLGVILDVVYNHLGISGAYIPRFAPYLKAGQTVWGELLNLDGPDSDEVRRYILDNALMWLRDYHMDGLRIDATHALVDSSAVHLLEEFAAEVDALSTHLRRPLSLIAESDRNDPRTVTPREAGGLGMDAQWDDDVHHAVHALITGERHGYYVDFGSCESVKKVLTAGFFHNGTFSPFRRRKHGRPIDPQIFPGHRLVAYTQNHDQIGNRAFGERLSALVSPGLLKVGAALIFTSPFTPMLFMGEEWGARTPWQYFTSHQEPELAARAIPRRLEEFEGFGWPEDGVIPDPQDPATYERSIVDWSEMTREPHADVLNFYRRLIAVRKAYSEFTDPRLDRLDVRTFEKGDQRWIVVHRGRFAVVCNVGRERHAIPVDGSPVGVLLASTQGFVFAEGEVELDGESVAIIDLGERRCPREPSTVM